MSGAAAVQKYCNFLMKKITFCKEIELVVPVALQLQLESLLVDNVLSAEFEKGDSSLVIAQKLCKTEWIKSLHLNITKKIEQGIQPAPFHHFYFPPLHERSNYTLECLTFQERQAIETKKKKAEEKAQEDAKKKAEKAQEDAKKN